MGSYVSNYDYFNTKLKINILSNDVEIIRSINHQIDFLANKMQYLFNYYDNGSDVYKLNKDKKIEINEENKELAEIIILALKYKKYTNNFFNIDNTFMNLDTIFFDDDSIRIMNEINLNSLVKGYLMDKYSRLLKHYKVEGYINFGGSILNHGNNLMIGIKKIDNHNKYVLNVKLHRFESIHTTANFEQKVPNNLNIENHEIRHIEANSRKTVSVIDIVSSKADALATAIYAMELGAALEFCRSNDIKAIIIDHNKIYVNKNIYNNIKIIDPLYTVLTY